MPMLRRILISRRSMRRASAACFMIVADQMQQPVHEQVRPVILEPLVLLRAPRDAGPAGRSPDRRAAAPRRQRLARREREHVGCLVVAAVAAIERATARLADHQHGNLAAAASAPERGTRPAAQRLAAWHPAATAGAQHGSRAAALRRAAALLALMRAIRGRFVRFVGLHDALYQRVAHHIAESKCVKATPLTPRRTCSAWRSPDMRPAAGRSA